MEDSRMTLRIKTLLGDYSVHTLFEQWSNQWITISSKGNRVLASFPSKSLEAAGKQHLSICHHFQKALESFKPITIESTIKEEEIVQ